VAVALGTAAFVGAFTGGAAAVVLSAALLTTAAAALAPVSTLLLAESRPDAPIGLTMGLNTSSATLGQIVGPVTGYAAFAVGGSRALGLSCLALALCAALGLRGRAHG
jgi:hypothetical protein